MNMSRRRFIAISAASVIAPGQVLAANTRLRRWTGHAMGAQASLSIAGMKKAEFERIAASVPTEIERLENIFSLHRKNSSLVRLNADAQLENPPLEFVQLLSLVGSVHRATGGAFDPTIQPLWRLYAETEGKPKQQALAEAHRLTGWDGVAFDGQAVAFAMTGMAMTLNGIAQGYATDRVAALLRQHGLKDVLVSVGEIAALGKNRQNRPWRIGISETEDAIPEEAVSLTNTAIATSAPAGMVFDTHRNIGHIVDPRTGAPAAKWRRISVINPSAAIADGLSTAFCTMTEPAITSALQHYPGSRLIAVDTSGKRLDIVV